MSRPVDRLVGVYDADGGLLGDLRYAVGRVRGTAHCALCDLTHGGLRARPAWRRLRDRLGVPVDLLHRDERDQRLQAACDGRVPCIVAIAGDDVVPLLGPDDLEACEGDLDEFERRLLAALGRTA